VQDDQIALVKLMRDIVPERSWAGASISLDPGTMAAGWASQVGYQKLLTSRFI
jgi:hypothetical protein